MERVRRKLAGAADGNRQMVDILTAVLTNGLPAVVHRPSFGRGCATTFGFLLFATLLSSLHLKIKLASRSSASSSCSMKSRADRAAARGVLAAMLGSSNARRTKAACLRVSGNRLQLGRRYGLSN